MSLSIEDPIDREIFILGAGFSKGLNAKAPLMVGFLKDDLDLLSRDEYRPVSECCERFRMDPTTLNIETLLTLASISKPWQTSFDIARDALAAESIRNVISEIVFRSFPERRLGNNQWTIELDDANRAALQNFANYLLRVDVSHVISFNYDPLLENALEHHEHKLFSEAHEEDAVAAQHRKPRFSIKYSYGFQGLIRDQMSGAIVRAESLFPRGGMLLLKLHGSVTWVSRVLANGPAFPEDILCFSCHEGNLKLEYYDVIFEKKHFIVPPILDKATLLRNPVVDVIWGQAAKLLPTAAELVFIGYSLPPTDYYSEYLFRNSPRRPRKVTVVDYISPDWPPDEQGRHRQRITARFRELYPFMADEDFRFDGAAAYCAQLKLPWQA